LLLRWAKENGYRAVGPITEIYWPARSAGAADVVEIQLGVRPDEDSPVAGESPSATGTAAGTVGPDSVTNEAGHEHVVVTANDPSIPGDVGEATDRVAPAYEGPDDAKPPARPSVEDLFQAGRYDAIAQRLLGPWDRLSGQSRAWLSQFVLRLSALERALESRGSPDSTAGLSRLIRTVRQVYDGATRPAADEDQDLRRWTAHDPKAAALLELDRLLARLATGSVASDQAPDEARRLIAEAVRLVEAEDAEIAR
jgi:hypothetical protein